MLIKHHVFRLLALISFLYTTTLHAHTYDSDILDIFSKTLPRFILMSSKKENIQKNLNLCVLHDDIDERVALKFIDKIHKSYPHGIKDYSLKVVNASYSKVATCNNSHLIFLFTSSNDSISSALKISRSQSILTVSYDNKLLKDGVSLSLFIGRKVSPHININSLEKHKIILDNVLLRISKIYKGGLK